MRSRVWLALALMGVAGPVWADDPHPVQLPAAADPHPLPMLAANPEPTTSIWKGLYVGSGITAVSGRGTRGFVGGDVFAGYDRAFDNHVVLGISGAAGTVPGFALFGPIEPYRAAAADLKLGYNVGRFTPYLASGVVVAKPVGGSGSGALSTADINGLFAASGRLEAAPRVGAGFDYALTNTTTIGLGLSYGRGPAAILP